MHDPKLVEALANWRCTHDTNSWAPCEACVESARIQIDRHRLVQLPEEPSEWEVQWGPDEWIGFQAMEDAVNFAKQHRPSTTGRIRAVRYVVEYSDPQEVEP